MIHFLGIVHLHVMTFVHVMVHVLGHFFAVGTVVHCYGDHGHAHSDNQSHHYESKAFHSGISFWVVISNQLTLVIIQKSFFSGVLFVGIFFTSRHVRSVKFTAAPHEIDDGENK